MTMTMIRMTTCHHQGFLLKRQQEDWNQKEEPARQSLSGRVTIQCWKPDDGDADDDDGDSDDYGDDDDDDDDDYAEDDDDDDDDSDAERGRVPFQCWKPIEEWMLTVIMVIW